MSHPGSTPEIEELKAAASRARERAHAPYSKYQVGAALRSKRGNVYVGCNVENATYGATLCAERVAVAHMVVAGESDIDAVLVFTDAGPIGMPCGICRQTLVEFAGPECAVIVASPRDLRITTLGALLPEPFTFRK
ncbi:MAG: cytidine deaminase [Myxococcota bacterium]